VKTCPNCGQQYADDDLRTMCGACMATLVPATEAAPARAPQPQPVQAPQPAAAPALAEQAGAIATLATQEPLAVPVLLTQDPSLITTQPFEPQPAPAPAAVGVIEQPAPPPAQRAAPSRGAPRIIQVGAGANARASAWAVLGFTAGFVALTITVPALVPPVHSGFVLLALAVWAAAAVCARQWSCYGWVRSATVAFPGRVRLGEKARARITLTATRPFEVDRVVLALVSQTLIRAGRVQAAAPITHREVTAASGFKLEANQAATFDVECTVPPDAPASFAARRASVEWFLRLWVAIPGWHADVRERVRFRVAPYLAEAPSGTLVAPQPLPIMDLADCRAEITIGAEVAPLDTTRAVIRTGAPTPVHLSVQPVRELGAAAVMARLDYRLRAKGSGDLATVFRTKVFDDDLAMGAPIAMDFTIPPLEGPLTFSREFLSVDWWLTIEIHQRQAPLRQARLAVVVLPGRETAEEALQTVTAGE